MAEMKKALKKSTIGLRVLCFFMGRTMIYRQHNQGKRPESHGMDC
jgi:hypothetical protein